MTKIVTMLRTITLANGYSRDVKTVTRAPVVLEFDPQLAPIIFVEDAEETYEYTPTNLVSVLTTVTIVGGLVPLNEQQETLEALASDVSLFAADVKVLFGLNTFNNSLENTVIYTKFRRCARDLGYLLPNRGAFALEMEVFYRYSAADPSVRGY